MSLASWKAEFYPIPADETAKDAAVAHSLQKWRGLTPDNLARHGIKRAQFGSIEDKAERFSVNTETCALCCHYRDDEDFLDDDDEPLSDCGACPLAAARGSVSCDNEREEEKKSPYQSWVDKGDPSPMLLWLEKAQSVDAVDPVGEKVTE
jgi:hypothetical protein